MWHRVECLARLVQGSAFISGMGVGVGGCVLGGYMPLSSKAVGVGA